MNTNTAPHPEPSNYLLNEQKLIDALTEGGTESPSTGTQARTHFLLSPPVKGELWDYKEDG